MSVITSLNLSYVSGLTFQISGTNWISTSPWLRPSYRIYNPLMTTAPFNPITNNSIFQVPPPPALPYSYTLNTTTQLVVGATYDFRIEVNNSSTGPSVGYIEVLNVTLNSGGGGEPICLVKNTQILTPVGYKAIETLSKGDLVVTDKRKAVPIQGIHELHYDVTTEASVPYTIKKHAFGNNSPPNNLRVSGRHAIQMRPGVWEIPQEGAKENKMIVQDPIGGSVTYYHIALPNYKDDNLIANGQSVESLNYGDKYKDTFVWNNEQNGYIRHIEVIQKSKSKTK
jgi:hypothetical protein